MNLTKDTYEYILNFADDRTILNMLSVNKKFRDEALFERIVKSRYPLLSKYIHYNTWTNYYVEIVYYLSKLQEEFDFPYIKTAEFRPQNLYERFKKDPNPMTIIIVGLNLANKSSEIEKIKYFLDRAKKELGDDFYEFSVHQTIKDAAKQNRLEIVKSLLEEYQELVLQTPEFMKTLHIKPEDWDQITNKEIYELLRQYYGT